MPWSRTVLKKRQSSRAWFRSRSLQGLFRTTDRWFPSVIVTQIPCMPSNRWAVCRGLPIGILGKTYSQPWGKGCTLSEQFSCRLQMSRAWQPLLPLKRKDLDVFGDSPLSLTGWKKNQNSKAPPRLLCPCPSSPGQSPALHSVYHLRPYVEVLITDILIFISSTEKTCLSSKLSY